MARKLGFLGLARDLICPPTCRICRRRTGLVSPFGAPSDPLCERCMPEWVNETYETCGICARRVTECFCMPKPLEDAGAKGFCKCLYYNPHKSRPVQNKFIHRIKKKADYAITGFLTAELSRSVERMLEEHGVDRTEVVITYLPRSREAHAMNGTDQAMALARELSRQMSLPCLRLIARTKGRQIPQKDLDGEERIRNAKKSFRAVPNRRCDGKTVILVDDVVTSGAGMSVGTKLLTKMGAAAVFCAAVAADAVNKDQIR